MISFAFSIPAFSIKRLFTALSLVIVSELSFGQKTIDEVTVDLGSGVLQSTTGIPFDVPFIIKGKADAGTQLIKMKYKIQDDDYQDWMRFPKKGKGVFSDSVIWRRKGADEFRLLSGPIHPNVGYIYEFTFYTLTNLSPEEKKYFKESVMAIIEFTMKDLGNTAVLIPDANRKLNAEMIKLFPESKEIVDKNLRPFSLDLNESPIDVLTQQVIDINLQKMVDATLPVNLNAFFSSDKYNTIAGVFKKIAENPDILDIESRKKLDEVIDGNNNSFKDITLGQLIRLFNTKPDAPKAILSGTATLEQGSIRVIKEHDLNAIELLDKFFQILKTDLKLEDGSLMLGSAVTTSIGSVMPPIFLKINRVHKFNKDLADKRKDILKNFEDILDDKLGVSHLSTTVTSVSDVVSEKNPYIGLDFGVSYIPGYDQLFFYEGVNFYFAPVNKDTPLRTFRKSSLREWLSKRISLHFGLTQSLIEVGNKRYLPLLKGLNSSLLGGAGIRINRLVRLNFGYLFFFEKDNNPVIDKKHFTSMPQFSITFDINVGKALGGIGKKLSLSQ